MIRWFRERVTAGVVDFRMGREGEVLVAEWPGMGIYRSDRSPRFVADAAADPARARKLALGPARAIDRAREGRPSLHAAAIAFGERSVLLVGASGAGKSTVAAACVLAGGALLADDMAFVDVIEGRLLVVPGESDHWLTADGLAKLQIAGTPRLGKASVAAASVGSHATPLATIVELVTDPSCRAITTTTLRGTAAMVAVSTSMFLLSEDGAVEHLDHVARIVAHAHIWRLRRPTDADPRHVASEVRRATVEPDG